VSANCARTAELVIFVQLTCHRKPWMVSNPVSQGGDPRPKLSAFRGESYNSHPICTKRCCLDPPDRGLPGDRTSSPDCRFSSHAVRPGI